VKNTTGKWYHFLTSTHEPTDLTGTTIGIIGLGLMGQPMAANLLKAGARLVIPTRSQHTLTEFSENQVEALETPREIVQAAETVILMLPDAEAVESVLKDTDGLLEGADAKSTIVDMGTTEAGVTEQLKSGLQALDARFIDAPVSGGRIGAKDGTLVVCVGAASNDDFDAILPILTVLGKNITHPGPCGSGQAGKAVNQLIAFSNQVALAEGMALARRSGLELNTLIPAMTGGAADSIALQTLGPRLAADDE
jgi:3-hydroxyisobutyrate dehydrogenase-like beta-hydroxyacid dehydrogenase